MINMLRPIRQGLFAMFGIFVLAATLPAMAQDDKPRETRGISIKASDMLKLGAQIPALKDYAMRIRMIVLKPGAVAGYHSHARHPVVAYLVSGDYTEHRDGMKAIRRKPGDQWVQGADVAHWSENRGTEPAYLINVDILPIK